MKSNKSFARGYSLIIQQMPFWIYMTFSIVAASVTMQTLSAEKGFAVPTMLTWYTVGSYVAVLLIFLGGGWVQKLGAKKVQCAAGILGGIVFILIPVFNNVHLAGLMLALTQMLNVLYCMVSSATLLTKWFIKRKGIILGVVTGSTFLSSLLCLPLFNNLIASSGIGKACLWFGLFLVVWSVISIFWAKDTPQECGLYPDNMSEEGYNSYLQNQLKVQQGAAVEKWTTLTVLKSPRVWLAGIGWGLVMMVQYGASTVSAMAIMEKGFDQATAVGIMSFAGLASLIFSVGSGFLDTRFGTKNISTIVLILLGIGVLGFAITKPGVPIVLLAAFFYLMYGSSGAPNNLLGSQTMDMSGPENYAVVWKVVLAIFQLMKALGPMVDNISLSATGGYTLAFWIFLGATVIAVFMIRKSDSGYLNLKNKAK